MSTNHNTKQPANPRPPVPSTSLQSRRTGRARNRTFESLWPTTTPYPGVDAAEAHTAQPWCREGQMGSAPLLHCGNDCGSTEIARR